MKVHLFQNLLFGTLHCPFFVSIRIKSSQSSEVHNVDLIGGAVLFVFLFFSWVLSGTNFVFSLLAAVQWGTDGRPFHFQFYTGKQAYYTLMHVSLS